MVTLLPTIQLRRKPRKALIEFVPEDIPIVGKLLTPAATPFLTGGLALLTGAKFLKALGTAGLTALGVGVLETSPKARAFAVEKIKDPTRAGREIGKLIEDPTRLLPKEKTLGEKVKEVAMKAGLPAAGVAAVVGAVAVAAKKIKERAERVVEAPEIPTELAPAALLPPAPTPTIIPFAAVEPTPKVEEIPVAPLLPARAPTIKNIFKPSIDISFRKSRKFINQQNIFRL